jgi:ActR/RegA family two-component response regulator
MIALPMRQEPAGSLAMNTSEHVYVAVVDDDDNFCRSLGRLLRAAGMQPIM